MTTTMMIESPLGPVRLVARGDALTAVDLAPRDPAPAETGTSPVLVEAAAQLAAYFAGERQAFDLPLAPEGTAFQRTVWDALCTIPYGATWSYGELARAIGRPTASRAVGAANGKNPLWIIVPCHRVIGTSGALTGYAGGLDVKRWLLAHEGRVRPRATGQLELRA